MRCLYKKITHRRDAACGRLYNVQKAQRRTQRTQRFFLMGTRITLIERIFADFFLVKIENVDLEIENTNISVNTQNTIHTSEF